MGLKGISKKVFLDRYALKNKKGDPIEKSEKEMWKRVAKGVAKIDSKNTKKLEKEYLEALEDFKYVPGGRILAGAGTGYQITYYNCFVIPSPKDSRGGILESLKQMVEVMAHGGGVGINMSSLRPKGYRVKKVNGFSSGPVNWAELFSVATKDIIQQGGSRRGALMIMLWDWHPDIEEFITVKKDLTKINGANLSVAVSDKLMAAVKKDQDWEFLYPDISDPEYDTKWDGDITAWKQMGKKVKVVRKIKARKLWDFIAEATWSSAEPGVVFMERYNKWHNNWYWNRINCVNPCGEEGLPPWGVCNLGSINLSALVKQEAGFKKPGVLDYKNLAKVAKTAVRFQDAVVDGDNYIFKGIKKMQLEGERRIGIGTMGLGDALIKMHLRYGSSQSLKVIDKIYKTIRNAVYEASCDLAKEKGAFPMFDAKKYLKGLFIQNLPTKLQNKIKKHGIRNSLLLMQAPTGSTSLMSGTTSGIEPVYEFEFIRKDRLGEHIIRHPLYQAWLDEHGVTNGDAKKIKRPDYFVGANDLTPEEHVKVQAVIQKYVDASISKTVNAPNNHTVEDVKNIYNLAYKLGLKGIAYMREGSRPGVLSRKEEKKVEKKIVPEYDIMPRPLVINGATYQIDTPVGRAFITVNTDERGEPFEVFVNIGKAGSDVFAMAEGLGRVISLILRINSPLAGKKRLEKIIEQLGGIGGARTLGFGDSKIRSLPDAVAKVLIKHFAFTLTNGSHVVKKVNQAEQASLITAETSVVAPNFDICPECGVASFAYEEGCKKCYSCGYSECG
jgi:ribonucleoside-diphosphate reductase alpha chain